MKKKENSDKWPMLDFDPEEERVKARNVRHTEFWDGLCKLDYAIRTKKMTAQERIRQILGDGTRAFDRNEVPEMHPGWPTLEYIGSFDMTYNYEDITEEDEGSEDDPPEERTSYSVFGNWDSLDEVALTELMRKELLNFLAAGGAFAKRMGSSTYETWVKMMTNLQFEQRCSFYIFTRAHPFDVFYRQLEGVIRHLWAEKMIAQHTRTRV